MSTDFEKLGSMSMLCELSEFDPDNAIVGKFIFYSEGIPPERLRVINLTEKWSVAIDEELEIVEITKDDKCVGWLFGVIIDLDHAQISDSVISLDANETDEEVWSAICDRFVGSWLCVLKRGSEIELRPDACATIGVVYEPETRRIASHAYLLTQDRYFERLLQDQRAANEVERDGWFTGGQTAHSGILRLLPNHCLSTVEFRSCRINTLMPAYTEHFGAIIDEIAEEILAAVDAARSDRKTSVCLTGGNETRAILAALRPIASALPFVTLDFSTNAMDKYLAGRLSQIAGSGYRTIPKVEASLEEKERWLVGAGHAMAGMNKDFFPTLRSLEGQYLVGGLGGEVGRGFLWPNDLAPDQAITPRYILTRLKLPKSEANVAAVTRWYDRLPPGLDAFQILDLAYLELRMGPWAFAQPRWRKGARSIHPLISYGQFRRMWSLPPRVRANDEIIRILIQRSWPELLDVPINSYGNWRDVWDKFVSAISRPDRALRKARQLLLSQN